MSQVGLVFRNQALTALIVRLLNEQQLPPEGLHLQLDHNEVIRLGTRYVVGLTEVDGKAELWVRERSYKPDRPERKKKKASPRYGLQLSDPEWPSFNWPSLPPVVKP